MNLISLAASLLQSKLGEQGQNLSPNSILTGLQQLLPTNASGDLDLSALMGLLNQGGLQTLITNWIGNGENQAISMEQVAAIFGQDKLASFAEQLGIQTDTATQGITEMLPELIEKNSSPADLVGTVLQSGALGNFAQDMLGKLFK